jgi:plasmid stabilization system protein ParE
MPPAIYLPEARDDIDEAYTTYQNRSPGLGERFLTSLQRTIGLVETNPQLYGEVATGIRAAPLRRFPHIVYYRATPHQVIVIAVRHGRDDPSIWQGRV